MTAATTPWTGALVRDRLGLVIRADPHRSLVGVENLVGLALRRNPRRAHLLVSTVLGKHSPTPPLQVENAGALLGVLVSSLLGDSVDDTLLAEAAQVLAAPFDRPRAARLRRRLHGAESSHPDAVTLGYAETATGLGRLVADQLGAYYVHSTRRTVPGARSVAGFEEEHSHATRHRLLPHDPAWLTAEGTVVLVDDELSTGTTILNTIRELSSLERQARWIVAALVDLRSEDDRARFDALATELDTSIEVIALGAGVVEIPQGFAGAAADLIEAIDTEAAPSPTPGATARVVVVEVDGTLPSDRLGLTAEARFASGSLAGTLAARLAEFAPARTLVLATEEFMAFPLEVATALDSAQPGILFSSTTRSPIAALDRSDYAIRSGLSFASHDASIDGPGPRFAYNLSTADHRFDRIVVVVEPGTRLSTLSEAGGLVDALRGCCDEVVVADVRLPREPLRGPTFGSYRADEVGWLLQDLGGVVLEAPAGDREAEIQSGRAHYAESLPQEYVPSPEYQELYTAALARSAGRVALAVGTVTELVLAEHENLPVLVSLARAGTPVGILMRRWITHTRGASPAHYTMSIVRGVGIDETALAWLAEHHDPADVVFVDGWTGKGAIARELTAALEGYASKTGIRFSDDLAVLADPGHSVRLFGTRDDYLIPSACLNSTVSGLVSRTVYSAKLIPAGTFHGAKYYRELASNDVSAAFLDAVGSHFPAVRGRAVDEAEHLARTDRTPTWEGWGVVERLQVEYGLDDINLIKPGVGETTRVLLRRVPWKILVRPDSLADVAHVVLLAEQRGVSIEYVDDLPYNCVGLIRPMVGEPRVGPQGAV